ncbi:MAG: DUF1292 domain-containing protein [Eubacteriales bacterium]|nr:DUF1292 domain-containing protein [Eubacteriales bacterium]MDD4327743.1 DUF1292 domain-containing protein [Eubacteriales bacterium]MDD4717495.1 DUF1292 domain-containing protein [Eubacteriales bacterium]
MSNYEYLENFGFGPHDHDDEHCCDDEDCCECGAEDLDGETTITMTDAEGNEYEFMLFDEFDYNEETYLLLMTIDDEEPELVIVKVVEGDDENDSLISVDEDEYDEVFAEYQRLCEEEDDYEDDLEET